MNWIKQHLVLFGLSIVLIVVAVMYGMSGGGTGQEQLLTTDVVASGSPSADTADRELVESLLTLRAITLSGNIFNDPAFKVLQDFGTTIIPEPVGRQNPFAPLPRNAPQSTGGQSAPRR